MMLREIFEKQEKLLGEVFLLLVMPFFVGIIFHYSRTHVKCIFSSFILCKYQIVPGSMALGDSRLNDCFRPPPRPPSHSHQH